jgi:hypothetical protein
LDGGSVPVDPTSIASRALPSAAEIATGSG